MNNGTAYQDDKGHKNTKPLNPLAIQRIIPGSMCYVVENGRVLLIQRNNPPHIGMWSPPGGKMEPGETPEECVEREVYEETGLRLMTPELRAVVTVMHAGMSMQWLLMVYLARRATGELSASNEGTICWAKLKKLHLFPRPLSDVHIFDHVVSDAPVRQFKYSYDKAENLIQTVMS